MVCSFVEWPRPIAREGLHINTRSRARAVRRAGCCPLYDSDRNIVRRGVFAVHTATRNIDTAVSATTSDDGNLVAPFFYQNHPYNKSIEHQNKDYPERHNSAILGCYFEKYNLFSKILNRKKEERPPSVTFICCRELLLPDIVNVLADDIFYNRV